LGRLRRSRGSFWRGPKTNQDLNRQEFGVQDKMCFRRLFWPFGTELAAVRGDAAQLEDSEKGAAVKGGLGEEGVAYFEDSYF
jgi:hypothetical protein